MTEKIDSLLFACPACTEPANITIDGDSLTCASGVHSFVIEDGIPLLLWPQEQLDVDPVTSAVRSFYEETPFPSYEPTDTLEIIRSKASKGVFAPLLDEQISSDAKILEAGYGTGQLSNFLAGGTQRTVMATDMSLNSLRLGQEFKGKNGIDNVTFCHMNLFSPAFQPKTFDVVISNGVLHHTIDPYLGFQAISNLVKSGGFIIIGLYNKFARIPTYVRQSVFKRTGIRLGLFDYRLGSPYLGDKRKQAWYKDQYQNPHESGHSMGEVVRWFDNCGFDFVSSVPMPGFGNRIDRESKLFENGSVSTKTNRAMAQLGLIRSGLQGSGLFVMIGRRRA